VSEFFVREVELATLRSLLGQPGVRLVTLTGPGGTGKTRLGVQVAAELVDRFRDGVFFVDLAAEREAESVFEAMVRDLGLASGRVGSPLQVLKVRLRERAMLLVLDNFEQVTEAAVGLADLLEHCRELKVVVTSRETLRLRGEHVLQVPPLDLPDPRAPLPRVAEAQAVRLFLDRARSVRPDFVLTEANARAVSEIVVRLDGLPLAIELAAARLKLFSAAGLLERLRERPDVLGSGPRDLPPRQRTLRSTIAWSYELLVPDERRIFELMSVFSTARLEAVEEVSASAHADVDVVEVLASLVDKSLVRSVERRGSQRFSMLQTVRAYAAERLAADPEQEAAVRRGHAEHFARYGAELGGALAGSGREVALEDLAADLANLRGAWRHWVEAGDRSRLDLLVESMWTLHETRGWYHGAADMARDLLGMLATVPASPERDHEELTLRASLARARMASQGYTPEVEAEFTRVLDLSASMDPAAQRFPVLRALATYFMNVADYPRCADLGRQILELAERERDDGMRLEGEVVFGTATVFCGDAVTGLRHLDRAIERFDPVSQAAGRFRLGTHPGVVARIASALILHARGMPDQAASRAVEAVEVAKRLDHPFTLSYGRYHAGFLDLRRRRFEDAREHALELAAVAGANDYLVWQALASVLEGVALCGMGRADEGIELTEAGHELYRGLTTPPVFWPFLLALLGSGFAWAGRPARALDLVERAMEAVRGDETIEPRFWVQRGELLAALPEAGLAAAEASFLTAIRGARAVGARLTELAGLTGLVGVVAGDARATAIAELRALYDTFTEGFDEPELVAAWATLGVDGGSAPRAG
jgi:predicted ATPase/tetratricopeptide (TPR) repeat protein